MALRKLVRSNYGRKSPVSIKHENLYSFKEEVILLSQSILETRRISHLHGSGLFTISLKGEVLKIANYGLFYTRRVPQNNQIVNSKYAKKDF